MNVFCVNAFEAGVDDSIFSGNEQQKVYFRVNEFEVGVNGSIFCGNEQQKV